MQNSNTVFNSVFSKQHKVFLESFGIQTPTETKLGKNKAIALSFQVNLEPLGFTLSKEALIQLSHLSEEDLTQVWSSLFTQAQQATGSHREFKAMYPNFPKQVLEASEVELLVNAFMHYAGDWFGVRILPKYEEKVRLPLLEKTTPKMIDITSVEAVKDLFVNLASANTSLSEADKEVVSVLFNYFHDLGKSQGLVEKTRLVQKENLAYVGNLVLKSDLDFNTVLAPQFTTPTDVLRLVAAMFNGDVSLAKPVKVGKMSRPMRKAILATLETQLLNSNDQDQLVENFFTYKEMWVRVAHALHPGEHAKKFPTLAKVFDDIRNNNRPVTFNSEVESLFTAGKIKDVANLLSNRPGVFARQLFRALENSNDLEAKYVIQSFTKCAGQVATPVLLQLHSHFLHQHEKTVKAFMPKGGLSKLYVVDNMKVIDKKLAKKVSDICESVLVERFKSFPELGNVYVDEALALQNVPFAQRSASKALKSVARGSRFDVAEDKDTVRLFLWWNEKGLNKEGKEINVGRVDIDLSCVLMDENYQEVGVCSYWNLTDGDTFAHSGDLTSAPKGACEFIDVDLSKLAENVRYLVMTISSYTQQPYSDLPECFAGWMMRDKPQSGKNFDARTVENKVDLTSDSVQMMPAIFDTKTRQFIWADIGVKHGGYGYYSNNVANNMSSIAYNVKAITQMIKPNLYDLFLMHAKARGNVVKNKEEADTVFSLHEGITPYDFEKIASEFMANDASGLEPEVKMSKSSSLKM